MTNLTIQEGEPTVTVSMARKINMGNYDSATLQSMLMKVREASS